MDVYCLIGSSCNICQESHTKTWISSFIWGGKKRWSGNPGSAFLDGSNGQEQSKGTGPPVSLSLHAAHFTDLCCLPGPHRHLSWQIIATNNQMWNPNKKQIKNETLICVKQGRKIGAFLFKFTLCLPSIHPTSVPLHRHPALRLLWEIFKIYS